MNESDTNKGERIDKDFDYGSIKDMGKEPLAWCDRCGCITFKSAIMDDKYCPSCWNARRNWWIRFFDTLRYW